MIEATWELGDELGAEPVLLAGDSKNCEAFARGVKRLQQRRLQSGPFVGFDEPPTLAGWHLRTPLNIRRQFDPTSSHFEASYRLEKALLAI
jgi:hypothetical protein